MSRGRRLFCLSLLRHLLTVLAGAIATAGEVNDSPGIVALSVVPFLASLGGSALAWWKAEQRVDVALGMPGGSSHEALEERMLDIRRQTFP